MFISFLFKHIEASIKKFIYQILIFILCILSLAFVSHLIQQYITSTKYSTCILLGVQ